MGEVVFWTIVRIVIIIPLVWIARGYLDYNFWWIASLMAVYGVVVHPALIHYKMFKEKNKDVIESTLCSSCKHFDESAVLCMLYDKHPRKDYLPCEGADWEPISPGNDKNKSIFH